MPNVIGCPDMAQNMLTGYEDKAQTFKTFGSVTIDLAQTFKTFGSVTIDMAQTLKTFGSVTIDIL